MIHRKLLIAAAIIASVAITACSDTTAPKKVVPGLPAAAILAPHPGPATVVATINGGGTADMEVPQGLLAGRTVFGIGVKLLSDGSATGNCTALTCTARPSRAMSGATLPGGPSTETVS